MPLSQDTRTIRLNTALGPDAMGVRHLVLREALGQPFGLEIAAVAEQPDIDLDRLIGTNLTVAIDTQELGKPRFINAFVTAAALTGPEGRRFGVHITAAPWLWLLSLNHSCRIFENKTAPDIVKAVLEEHGLGRFRFALDGSYPTLRYCVQYNESDLAFVSRLLEREGIYYHFEHSNGAHELVLTDSVGRLDPRPGYETYLFRTASQQRHQGECVLGWQPRRELRPTRVALGDYNPDQPGADMVAESAISRRHRAAGFEVYAYPGGYAQRSEGVDRARVRIEALQASHARIAAEGTLRGVATGATFTLQDHPLKGYDGRYYVVEALHRVTAPGYEAGASETGETYDVSFVAAPVAAPFRPLPVTPWPRIAGTQTAMVVGADGEEIDPGTHVAVKVCFHWLPATPSCWIRTSQPWTGPGWGAMAIPRIGEEVVVAFEEGDPDRPLIVGRVYNGTSKPPYDPVAQRTVTTFKTNSSTGGGGFNELRFDDKTGSEGVFLHAQKDLDQHVRNTARTSIDTDSHLTVGKSATAEIGEDRHTAVGGDSFEAIGGNASVSVGADSMHEAGGGLHATAGGDALLTAGTAVGVTAGTEMLLTAGTDGVLTTGTALHLKAGTTLVIEAGVKLSLKVGGSFVDISPAGVAISGPTVMINSGGAAGTGSGKKAAKATKPEEPRAPDPAATAKAGKVGQARQAKLRKFTAVELDSHPTAAALRAARAQAAPFCMLCEQAARGGDAR